MENNDCQYEQCYVAFLDILGFSAMVMESRRKTEILEQLVNCLDTCSCMPSGGKEVTKINGQSLVLDIQTRYCSDTVGFFMRENQIHFPHLLLMIRYLQDRLWELGICLRGGLALGKMYWNPEKPNITLGTGWINAYKLENEVATYPRIVVEEALYNSLRDEREPPYPFGSSPSYRDSIKDYIKRDADGVYFLDLLNRNIVRKKGEHLERMGNCFSIVWDRDAESSCLDIEYAVQKVCTEGLQNTTAKVQQKYHWLENYMYECARGKMQ